MSRLKIFIEAQSKYFWHENSNLNPNLRSRKKQIRKKEAENSRWISGIFPTRRQQ